ncbi:MAG: hypothetical protein ACU0CA_03745 [Paracoccaceae bacterium]
MKTLIKATTTPLASIFGSGFLVIVPILAGAVGPYSVYAMALVCAVAFAVGTVIRFNIGHAEPVLANKPPRPTLMFERFSDIALVLAYVISVCLYLQILSSFVLGGLGFDTEFSADLLTTGVIALIIGIGIVKGLDELEVLEQWALLVTLVIIGLIFAGFAHYDLTAPERTLPALPDRSGWQMLTIIAGTLIVVQGFETPRYLEDSFDAATRIKASRLSQIISTFVYVIFVALALPVATLLNGSYDDDSLLTMVKLAGLFTAPVILAAALSQFSAAVADTISATGNMAELTNHRLKPVMAYLIIGIGAITLTWLADTFQIVALASRAFAFYYMLQCFVAISVSKSTAQKTGFAAIAVILAFITIFAVPAG